MSCSTSTAPRGGGPARRADGTGGVSRRRGRGNCGGLGRPFQLAIPREEFQRVGGDEEAAAAYERTLREAFGDGLPELDLLILGIGPLLSNFLSARLGVIFKVADGGVNYHRLFLVPLGLGVFASAILAIFFHPKAKEPVAEEVPLLVT